MPHLILEHSDNLIKKIHFHTLFRECHEALTRILPTELKSCKSRAIECKEYYLGDGAPDYAFIHLTIRLFAGRSLETMTHAANSVMQLLQNHMSDTNQKIHVSIEMVGIDKTHYFKADI